MDADEDEDEDEDRHMDTEYGCEYSYGNKHGIWIWCEPARKAHEVSLQLLCEARKVDLLATCLAQLLQHFSAHLLLL